MGSEEDGGRTSAPRLRGFDWRFGGRSARLIELQLQRQPAFPAGAQSETRGAELSGEKLQVRSGS